MQQTFDQWMQKVDKIIENVCGLSSQDLPDKNYLDFWEDGYTPTQAAKVALNDEDD